MCHLKILQTEAPLPGLYVSMLQGDKVIQGRGMETRVR